VILGESVPLFIAKDGEILEDVILISTIVARLKERP